MGIRIYERGAVMKIQEQDITLPLGCTEFRLFIYRRSNSVPHEPVGTLEGRVRAGTRELLQLAYTDAVSARTTVLIRQYQVTVGNIGTIYSGTDETQADSMFQSYVENSKAKGGRASGESVTLLIDGEVSREYEA